MSKGAVPPGFTHNSKLFIGVFGFDLQLLLAGLTNPSMFAVDEGMVVDALPIILRAKITRHGCQHLCLIRSLFGLHAFRDLL